MKPILLRLKERVLRELKPILDFAAESGEMIRDLLKAIQQGRFRWYHFIIPLLIVYYIGRSHGQHAAYRELEKYIPEEVKWDSMDYWEGREVLDGPDDSMEWP